MRIRNDYKEATEAIASLAIIEGQKVEYIPKEERHRTDTLDPNLEESQVPVHLLPGITVGGQEIPSGIGMTTTGTTTNDNLQKVR